MREPPIIRMLPDRRRLHLSDGPIDLIVEAGGIPQTVQCAYEAAARRFVTILDELCAELPLLRTRASALLHMLLYANGRRWRRRCGSRSRSDDRRGRA